MDEEHRLIWKGYDPKKVKEALQKSAGALAGLDSDTLLQDITASRQQDSHGRPSR